VPLRRWTSPSPRCEQASLAGICTAPGDAKFGSTLQLLEGSSPNVLVSALLNKNGQTYLRMHEHCGRNGSVPLRYLAGPAELVEVDLAERGKSTLSSPISFRPWQIRTIKIIPSIDRSTL
jgi:hypothetical protein